MTGRRIRRSMLMALPLALGLFAAPAGAQERPHRFATLALWDPVSTTPDREATTNFRLAVVQSYLHSVKGLDVTGISSQLGGDIRGVALTGVYSHVKGGGSGVVLAGFGSYLGGEFTGLQGSLIMNIDRAWIRGVQYAGLVNFNSGGFSGLQWAGWLNMNDGPGVGWQASTAANLANGRYVGAQTATFFNFANVELTGVQIAGLNWTRHLKGAQIGVLNIAGDARGLQLGLVNLTEQNHGIPVGLVNVAENGEWDLMAWGSSYLGAQAGVRTTVNDWYSILSLGGIYLNETDLDVVSIAWNYGRRFGLSERFSLSVDAGYVHVIPDTDPLLNDRLRPAVQGRAFLEFGATSWLSVHAGAGGNYEWSEYASGAATEFDPLFFGGISVSGRKQ